MLILSLVGYIGVVTGFCFLTLAIASGLYYLSEQVEEHSVLARRLLYRLIYSIIACYILLYLVDGLPLALSAFSIVSHAVYASNLRRFPIVRLSDPLFILSCLLVGLNHWVWFRHFSDPVAMQARAFAKAQSSSYSSSSSSTSSASPASDIPVDYYYPSFTEIASFFGLCVWLVPFALFVSLSAAENVLPSMGSEYATGGAVPSSSSSSSAAAAAAGGERKGRNVGMAKALVDSVREWMGETGQVMGWWRGEKVRRF